MLPKVESGQRAGPGFIADRGRNFPNTFARAYATAEEAGGIDDEMARWSRAFADQAETAIARLAAAAPKIIYALVAVFVIYQIFQLAGGYFGQLQGIMDRMENY